MSPTKFAVDQKHYSHFIGLWPAKQLTSWNIPNCIFSQDVLFFNDVAYASSAYFPPNSDTLPPSGPVKTINGQLV